MNSNPESTPQKKDDREISASEFLKNRTSEPDSTERKVSASKFLQQESEKSSKSERKVSASDFLTKSQEKGEGKARPTSPDTEGNTRKIPFPEDVENTFAPSIMQFKRNRDKNIQEREKYNERSALLDEGTVQEYNRYISDISSGLEGLPQESKKELFDRLSSEGFVDEQRDSVVVEEEYTGGPQQLVDIIKNDEQLKGWADDQIGGKHFENDIAYDNAILGAMQNMDGEAHDRLRTKLDEEGLLNKEKDERVVGRSFTGSDLDLLQAINNTPSAKKQVLDNIDPDKYNTINPGRLGKNIEQRRKMEGAIEDVQLRQGLIGKLTDSKKDLQKKIETLKEEAITKGTPTPNPKTGNLQENIEIADGEKYEELQEAQKELKDIDEKIQGLQEEQLYLMGTDEQRQELDEGTLQKSVEEFTKGVGRGVVNLPKSVATIGANFAPNTTQRLSFRALQNKLQDVNESETLSNDADLKGKQLEDIYDDPSKLIAYLSGGVGEAVPTMLPGLAAAKAFSGAGRLAQAGAATFGSWPIEAGPQLQDMERHAREENREPTAGEKAIAVGSSFLSAAGEGISDVGIMRGITKAIDNSGLDKTAKEALKKEAGEEISSVGVKALRAGGKGFGIESLTEMVQGRISNLGAKYGWDPDRDIWKGIWDEGLIGGLTGLTVSGAGVAAGETMKRKADDIVKDRSKNLKEAIEKNQKITEGDSDVRRLDDNLSVTIDTDASPDQQLSQIESERNRMKAIREFRKGIGQPTDGPDAIIDNLNDMEAEINENEMAGDNAPTDEIDANKAQQEVNEDAPNQEDDNIQESQEPIGTTDNPLTANIDERYQSWVERDNNSTPTIQVKNAESGNTIDYRSNNRKGIIEDFQRQGSPGLRSASQKLEQEVENLTEQEKSQVMQNSLDSDGNISPDIVLKESEDPAEIADAIERRKQEYGNKIGGDTHITLKENYWSGNQPLPVSSIKRWGDWNSLKQNIKSKARNSEKYEGEMSSADQLAQEASTIMGKEVTPEEVVESFVQHHQEAESRPNEYSDPTTDLLADKFKEITGQKYTPEFGKRLQDAKREYQENKAESDFANRLEQDESINYNETLQEGGPIAEMIGEGKPLTEEEFNYVNQQAEQYREESAEGDGESQVPTQEASGVQSQEEQWRGFGSREDLKEAERILDEAYRKQGGQFNIGIDPATLHPQTVKAGLKVAGYAIQDGAIKFSDFAQELVSKMGDGIKPYLRDIYIKSKQRSNVDNSEFSSDKEIQKWLNKNDISEEHDFEPFTEKDREQLTNDKSDSDLDIPTNFASAVKQESTDLLSEDGDTASEAVERLAEIAIDNGVSSVERFQAWMLESFSGNIDGDVFSKGWNDALYKPHVANKYMINNMSGSIWEDYKRRFTEGARWLHKKFVSKNSPLYVLVDELIEKYGDSAYFEGKNEIKNIKDILKLQPGRVRFLTDKYTSPERDYSYYSRIMKEIVSRDINTIGWQQIEDLYRQRADAEGDMIRRIDDKIDKLIEQDELHQYLIANHAIESNQYSRSKNKDLIKELEEELSEVENELESLKGRETKTKLVRSKIRVRNNKKDNIENEIESLRTPLGMSNEEALETLHGFQEDGRIQDLEAVAEMIYEMNDQLLDLSVEFGLISEYDAKNMRDTYNYYVPAQRIMTTESGALTSDVPGSGGASGVNSYRTREGSTRRIRHVLSNVMANANNIIRGGARNQAVTSMSLLIDREIKHGNDKIGRVADRSNIGDPNYEMATNFIRIEHVPVRNDNGTTTLKKRAVKKSIVWQDELLYETMEDSGLVTLSQYGVIAKYGFKAMNMLRNLITSYAPSFAGTNMFRDADDAFSNISHLIDGKAGLQFAKNLTFPDTDAGQDGNHRDRIFALHRAIIQAENGNLDSEASQLYWELKEMGGTSGMYRFRDHQEIVGEMQELESHMREMMKDGLSKGKAIEKLKNTRDFFELMNEMVENATRLAIYKTARDAGLSKQRSAVMAKDTNVNFDEHGDFGAFLKLGYMFINAGIQSMAAVGRAARSSKFWAGYILARMTGSFFLAMLNDAADDDYEKDKIASPYKYNRNLVIAFLGNPDSHITIPLGYGYAPFNAMGGNIYDLMQGYIDTETFFQQTFGSFADSYNPLGGSGMFESSKGWLQAITPTLAKPFLEPNINKNFFGNIYSPFGLANADTEDWQLRDKYNSYGARYVSDILARHEAMDVSPQTFDYLADYVGGTAYQDVMGAYNIAQGIMGYEVNGEKLTLDKALNEAPIVKRFMDIQRKDRIASSYLWSMIQEAKKGRVIEGTDKFYNTLDDFKKQYNQLEESGALNDDELESLDRSIQGFIRDSYKQKYVNEAIEHFDEKGWYGDEHKEERQQYYKSKNNTANKIGIDLYQRWKDGRYNYDNDVKIKPFNSDAKQEVELHFKRLGSTPEEE